MSGAFSSQVEFFFRESRNQIATKNLLIDRCWGIDSGDCSVCLESLEKRKVTLKQCEATVWSGSEFAEHCFVFSNLFVFLSLSCIQNPEPASIPQCLSVRRNFISAIWFRPNLKKNPYDKSLFRPLYPLTSPFLFCKIVRRVFRDSTYYRRKRGHLDGRNHTVFSWDFE